MAFCEQCGNKLNDTAKFCGKCGATVASGQAETTILNPAPGVCAQCGAPLDEDEVFCSNCGTKVGAVPVAPIKKAPAKKTQAKKATAKAAVKKAPAKTQGQAGSDEVLKEGVSICISNAIPFRNQGILILYRDRLEWKWDNSYSVYKNNKVNWNTINIIPIEEISSVKLTWTKSLKIILNSKDKYDFLSLGNDQEIKSWLDAINSVRNGTLG